MVSAFIALRTAAATHLDGVYFAAGGLALIVALIETSYAMAYLDELTQLPSRRALNEALLKLGDSYTLAMMDVDHFKKFNDSYGHEAGDQALRMVASRLAHITGGGRAYRYGGEEFAVVFPNKPAEEVFVYLDRMRRVIERTRVGKWESAAERLHEFMKGQERPEITNQNEPWRRGKKK